MDLRELLLGAAVWLSACEKLASSVGAADRPCTDLPADTDQNACVSVEVTVTVLLKL